MLASCVVSERPVTVVQQMTYCVAVSRRVRAETSKFTTKKQRLTHYTLCTELWPPCCLNSIRLSALVQSRSSSDQWLTVTHITASDRSMNWRGLFNKDPKKNYSEYYLCNQLQGNLPTWTYCCWGIKLFHLQRLMFTGLTESDWNRIPSR